MFDKGIFPFITMAYYYIGINACILRKANPQFIESWHDKEKASYTSNIKNLGEYPRTRSEDLSLRVNGCMNGFTKKKGLDESFTRLELPTRNSNLIYTHHLTLIGASKIVRPKLYLC